MTVVLTPAAQGLGQGQTGSTTPGTGRAVPGGVESTFEFNGILLNERNWIETYLVTDIDGLDDADVRDERAVNPVQHGETAYDAYYGGRTITLTGKIRAYSLQRMRDMIQALAQAFGDLQEHDLVMRSGRDAQNVKIACRKYQKLTIHEAQTNFQHIRDFQISLRAAAPFFLSNLENYAPITVPTSPGSVTIVNKGNFEALPRFVIAGPITDPQIVNTTTGGLILLNGTIASGDVWTLDMLKRTIHDQNGVNKFSALDVTSDWITLVPGDNVIQITGTGLAAGTTLQIYWSDTWV